MFSVQSTLGFASGYQNSYIFDEAMLCFYAQDHLGVYPNVLGGLYAPAPDSEVSPWAWQWGEGTVDEVRDLFQSPPTHHTERVSHWQDSFTRHSYTTSITQPQVQPTYAMDQAPPTFCRVVGGPVSNTNRPEIVCPRPTYPPPKWIDITGWEEDEERDDLTPGPVNADNDTDWEGVEWSDEEDWSEGLDDPRRFLPSFILSPDPEELPAPFFHSSSDSTPSSRMLASLSPEACDLPQPCFDPDPYSPVSGVSSRSSALGPGRLRSSRSDSFGSIVSPDPGDLPPPDFEIYDRIEVEGFEFPEPLECHQNRLGKRGTRGHARWGLGEGLWKAVTSAGRKVSGSGHRRRWLDWTWDG